MHLPLPYDPSSSQNPSKTASAISSYCQFSSLQARLLVAVEFLVMASTEMAMGKGVSRHGMNFMAVITKLIVLLTVSQELLMCEAQGVAAAGSIQRT